MPGAGSEVYINHITMSFYYFYYFSICRIRTGDLGLFQTICRIRTGDLGLLVDTHVYSAAEQQGAQAVDDGTFEFTQRAHLLLHSEVQSEGTKRLPEGDAHNQVHWPSTTARETTRWTILWGEVYSRVRRVYRTSSQIRMPSGVET